MSNWTEIGAGPVAVSSNMAVTPLTNTTALPSLLFQFGVVLMSHVSEPTRQVTIWGFVPLPTDTLRSMDLFAVLLRMVATTPVGSAKGAAGTVPESVPVYLISG